MIHHAKIMAASCGLLLIGACSGTDTTSPKSSDPYAVQVGQAGEATCLQTSSAANQTGADATNTVRTRAGLAPVRPNATLAKVAAQHACDMAQRGRMTHIGSKSSGPGPRVKAAGYAPRLTAENIAAGPYDLNRVLAEWNSSSGHLANITIEPVRDFGIGQAIGADGKTRYWAAIYAAPK